METIKIKIEGDCPKCGEKSITIERDKKTMLLVSRKCGACDWSEKPTNNEIVLEVSDMGLHTLAGRLAHTKPGDVLEVQMAQINLIFVVKTAEINKNKK